MRLETAIFTSIKGERLNGYQLAAASPGIGTALAQELTVWGPAHDSLWDTRRDARSVNFFPLPTGDFCLSITTLAGAEYSGRGGGRVYTQMFLLPAAALASFANDPFLVLRALSAAGRVVVHDHVPERLSTVPLLGRSSTPDPKFSSQVLDEVGPRVFQELLDAIAGPTKVAVLTSGQVERLFQSLLHALPFESRPALSFTTNLKDSPRRPFKLFVLPNDPALIRQSQRLNGAIVVDLAASELASAGISG
jgi:hypothetical protein